MQYIIYLFKTFLHVRDSNTPHLENNQNSSNLAKSSLQLDSVGKPREFLTNTFIDKLESPPRAFNCLKRVVMLKPQ